LTPEEKQSELRRHRAILLATLDYLEERLGGSFVCDQCDPVAEYYQRQKIQTEKYFKQSRLDRLQQRLATLTNGLEKRVDLAFAAYIKEKTGYDIDIFEDLRNRVNSIIAQNEIRCQNELNDVGSMLRFYRETAADRKKVEKLKSLLTDYSKETKKISGKGKSGYSEVISIVEKDSIEEVTVRISSGPKPKHFEEKWETSPDGKRKLRIVQWSDGKHASTCVDVMFPTASGTVYDISGIHPDVKALWKDNSTIVIETKKLYPANAQHRQVRSFNDVINIEYIEH
jgi:hypothetical protein